MRTWVWGLVVAAMAAACARGGDGTDGAGAASGSGASATGASSAGGSGAGGTTSSGTTTSGTTSGTTSSGSGGSGAGGMDPGLGLPDPNGEACTQIGSGAECSGVAVCRIYGPDSGICESCGTCGNLGDFCTKSSECDILFQCYEGVCTNLCPLGTSYCGPVQDCLDVGHATWGVCKP